MAETGRKRKTEKPQEETRSIEELFLRVDEILEKMEEGDTSLEQSFRLYEEGLSLIKQADSSIEQVEKKLRVLNGEEEEA